jgi:hypothetical protein
VFLLTFVHSLLSAPQGYDSSRFWEALYIGCVPIVEANALSVFYDRFPTVVLPGRGPWSGKFAD